MNIKDLLNGKEFNKENLYALQKDPRCSGMSKHYDGEYAACVEDALKKINSRNYELMNKKIPRERSEVLSRCEDDYLSVEFLQKKMKDKRYSGAPCERDPVYIKAIEDGFRELCPPDTQEEPVAPVRTLLY